jgi:hypothetical protein
LLRADGQMDRRGEVNKGHYSQFCESNLYDFYMLNHTRRSVAIMYRQFNIQQFHVLPTQCIYVFCLCVGVDVSVPA